jgi:hypothetical protein
VANAVCALQEIFNDETVSDSGGNASGRDWLLSKEVIYTLLNRIRDFSEWAQCIILSLAAEYVPEESVSLSDILCKDGMGVFNVHHGMEGRAPCAINFGLSRTGQP